MNKQVWITRPSPQAEITAAQLSLRGIASIIAPAICLTEVQEAAQRCSSLSDHAACIITSQKALQVLARYTAKREYPLLVTGEALQQMAHGYGFTDVTAGQGNAASIMPLLSAEHYYYLHGNHTAFDMKGALQMLGIRCTTIEIYRSDYATTLSDALILALREQNISAITCYSVFTAQAMQHLLIKHEVLHDAQHLPIYCISDAIGNFLKQDGFSNVICDSPQRLAQLMSGG